MRGGLIFAALAFLAASALAEEVAKPAGTMQLINTIGTSDADDGVARLRCRQLGYPLMWRLLTSDGRRTRMVWCLISSGGLPKDAVIVPTGGSR